MVVRWTGALGCTRRTVGVAFRLEQQYGDTGHACTLQEDAQRERRGQMGHMEMAGVGWGLKKGGLER